MVKMVDLHRQYLEIRDELDISFKKILKDSAFIRGEEINMLENELAEFFEVKHCVTCANGTDALTLSLMAIGIKPGDEVIVPAFSFAATAEAAALLGAVPVFADIDRSTFNISPGSVERLLSRRTKAIIPVHLFGQPCDMGRLMDMAISLGIKVIEDNAQALGATCGIHGEAPRFTGTIGHFGCTSFFPTKPLGAFGDGGAIFTDDDLLAEHVRSLANHGQSVRYTHRQIGMNSRLDTLQAAVLRAKLPRLKRWNEIRRKAALYYSENLAGIDGIELPAEPDLGTHIYHQYTVKVPSVLRDPLRAHLGRDGISSMVYYPKPLHLQPAYKDLCLSDSAMTVSGQLSDSVISLPIHSHISTEEQDKVVASIKSFFSDINKPYTNG